MGFPGETEEEYEELLDFIQKEEFDYTSVFSYSREEGTRGAEMDGQIDEDVKLERAQGLIDIAEELGLLRHGQARGRGRRRHHRRHRHRWRDS